MVKSLSHFLNQQPETSESVSMDWNAASQEDIINRPSPFSQPVMWGMQPAFQPATSPPFYIEVPLDDCQPRPLVVEDVYAYIETLVNTGWCVLKASDNDPLDVLFSRALTQWYVLVHPDNQITDVYLLWKQQPNILEVAEWSLYQNSELIYQGEDDGDHISELIQSEALSVLPVLTFLKKNQDNALIRIIQNHPSVFSSIKLPLFEVLEQFYTTSGIPVLNQEMGHILTEKTRVVGFLKKLFKAGVFNRTMDCQRLDRALNRLSAEFEFFSKQANTGLSTSLFYQAYRQYHAHVTDGLWRVRLSERDY